MAKKTNKLRARSHRMWPAFKRHLAVALFVVAIAIALLPYDKSVATPRAVAVLGH